jgi:TusA-related sulfurtransferase
MIQTDKTLDVKGLAAPKPVILADRTLTAMLPGQVLRVITSDSGARTSFPELCRERGYELLELREEAGILCFVIRK